MRTKSMLVAAMLAAAGLAGIPAAHAAVPCQLVADPPGDPRYFLVGVNAGALDITSADIRIDKTWTTIYIRVANMTAQDEWSTAWSKRYVFLWHPQRQKPGTPWYGVSAFIPARPEIGQPPINSNYGKESYKFGVANTRNEEGINIGTAREAQGRVTGNEIHIWVKNSELRKVSSGSLSANVKQGEFKVVTHAVRPDGTDQTPLDKTDDSFTKGVYVSGKSNCVTMRS